MSVGLNGNGRIRVNNLDPLDRYVYGEIVKNVTANLTSERMEVLRRGDSGQDPRRSVNAECGFPEGTIGVDAYRFMYERNPIAKRVVEVMPKESWQTQPTVYEDEDADNVTEFEEGWDNLAKDLRGGSMFQDEEGSPVWEYLTRLDIGSRIASFGVMLIGIDDGKNLQDPVDGSVTTNSHVYANWETAMLKEERDVLLKKFPEDAPTINSMWESTEKEMTRNSSTVKTLDGKDPFGPDPSSRMGTDAQYFGWYGPSEYQADKPSPKKRKIMFLRVFPEYLVQVVRYESNLRNPRFGQPVMYRITLNDPRDNHSGVGLPIASIYVHWTRVQHAADVGNGFTSSEIFAPPAMRPVFNNLMGLDKLYGASPEAFWKGCVNALAFNTHPQLGGDVNLNLDDMRDQVENFQNSLQKFLAGMGGTWSSLAPAVSDPTPHVNCQLEAICVALGIPKRIFMGSERGELASSQDDGAWNDRLKYRQYYYITPRLIVPFVDRLILLGVLPPPSKDAAKKVVTNALKRGKIVRNVGTGYLVYNAGAPSDNLPSSANPNNPSQPNPNATEISQPKGKPVGFISGAGYSVQWKDLESNTQMDKATIANTRTTALAAYVSGGLENLMPPFEYLVHIMEFDEEEAQAIIDAGEKHQEEAMDKHSDLADQAEEQDLVKTPPPGFEVKPPPPPPMPGMPGGPPTAPVKMGAGESLVHPETGKTVAKTPFPPKPPVKNMMTFNERVETWNQLKEDYKDAKRGGYPLEKCLNALVRNFVDSQPRATDGKWTSEGGFDGGAGETGGFFGPKTDKGDVDKMKDQVAKDIAEHGLHKFGDKEKSEKFSKKQDKYLRKQFKMGKGDWRDLKEKLAKDPTLAAHDVIPFAMHRTGKSVKNEAPWPVVFNYDEEDEDDLIATRNSFCPTGPGGGVDATCSPGGSSGSEKSDPVADLKNFKTAIGHPDISLEHATLVAHHVLGQLSPKDAKRVAGEVSGSYGITSKKSALEKVINDLHTLKSWAVTASGHDIFKESGQKQPGVLPHVLAALPRAKALIERARGTTTNAEYYEDLE